MKKTLLKLKKDLFDRNGISFIVVGSLALQESGFDVNPHDIDIEAVCLTPQENILATLVKASGSDFHENYNSDAEKKMENVTWRHKPYIFKWNGVSINVWAVSKFSHPYFISEEGIKYAKPISVLKKKMAYQRPKDYQTLNKIVNQIINLGE